MKARKHTGVFVDTVFSLLLHSGSNYVRHNWTTILIFTVCYFSLGLLSFLKVSSSGTVDSVLLSDYEIGQIADRTIVAEKELPADEKNPISLRKGEKITRKGFPITDEDYQKLKKVAETRSYIDYRVFTDSLLYLFLVTLLWVFLFSSNVLKKQLQIKVLITFAVWLLIIYTLAVSALNLSTFSSPYMLPVILPASLCVILATIMFGQLAAIFFSFVIFFAVLDATSFNIIPSLFLLLSCLSVVRLTRHISRRSEMVFLSLLHALLNVVFMITLKIIFTDAFSDWRHVLFGIAFTGFFSGILALGLLTPLENLLNTASAFRLMDLSDLNSPLLRRFMLAAPGTYNHSVMVATLAENACAEIGANSLLARVGAYYHDIGKMEQPEYFVENQSGNNKHDDINPRLSVAVIKSHVKKGVEKCRQLRLPQEVIDIVAEHHGNGVIAYFYAEAKKQDDTVSPEEFSYPGNPPTSREAAVVMLADTAEAACRTLDKPTAQRLDKFIRQLIMEKVDHRQLDHCDLTFRDLNIIRDSFVRILAGYYHSRIEYPDQKENAKDSPEKGSATATGVPL
jgi:putative nucleotidyltransferase with HDIG domain